MNITIKSEATDGNLIVLIINSNGATILKLRNTEEGSCILVPGKSYRFEWHVWNNGKADYKIEALVEPPNAGFAPFNWEKHYDYAHEDVGGFYFTV